MCPLLAATVWGTFMVCFGAHLWCVLQPPAGKAPARSRRVLPEEPHSPIRSPPKRAAIAAQHKLSVEMVTTLVEHLATSDAERSFGLERRLKQLGIKFDRQEERSKTAERWATDIRSVLVCHTPLVRGWPQCRSAGAGGSRQQAPTR